MNNFIQKSIKRVAIIGGGAGGIAAARALRNEATFQTITIFERNEHNGGTWKYSPETNEPPPIPSTNALEVDVTLKVEKLHSPIYSQLHTNLPKSIMCYHDFPMSEETPLFPHHTQVMDYLTHVVASENLLPLIRFCTLVENVEYIDDVWKVTVNDKKENKRYTEEFDAVIVATGHYAVPQIPSFPGLVELNKSKNFQVVHSRDYRCPDNYKDKVILVVGAGASAIDIVRETSAVATKVYQCIRTQTEFSRRAVEGNASNVHQISLIKRFINEKDHSFVELENGDILKDVDAVILGTGYLYSFPFFPFQKDNLIKTGQKVHHLDHYMFYRKNPTLSFIGLPIRVVPLPLMHRQSIVVARYLSGKIPMVPHGNTLTKEDDTTIEDNRLDFVMGIEREFDYNEKLGAWAEGWTDADIEKWQSTDVLTGRLSERHKELRINALLLRKEYLGY